MRDASTPASSSDLSLVAFRRVRYLIIEDDIRFARALARFFGRHGCAEVAHTNAEAAQQLAGDVIWSGLVVDVGLPDGSGLDLLESLRCRGDRTPALVLTGQVEFAVMRRAELCGALFLPKPPEGRHLNAFIDWARRHHAYQLDSILAALAHGYRLSRRETEILRFATCGFDHGEIAEQLGVQMTTLRTVVRRLIRKTGEARLRDLVARVHRDLLL